MCPPRGSNTGLNYDFDKTQERTLDDAARNDLITLALELIHVHGHDAYSDLVSGIVTEDDLALMYSGHRLMTLLEKKDKGWYWSVSTSGGHGECSTPSFRKERD